MQLPWMSTSSSKGTENCASSAIREAIDRIMFGNDYNDTIFTHFGSIVHNVAERMHELDMEGKVGDPVELFDMFWRRTSLTEFSFYKFGKENIQGFIERTLYDRPGDTWATELSFLVDIVNGDLMVIDDDTDQEEILKYAEVIEKRGGVPYRSAIDRIDVEKDEDGTHVYVFDYKTNFVPFTRDEVESSEQLAIYSYVAKLLFPEAENVFVCYDMLRHGRFWHSFSDEDERIILDLAVNKWYQFFRTPVDDLPVELNRYCGYCNYKNDCSVYKAALEEAVVPFEDPDLGNIVELLDQLDRFKLKIKLLDQNVKTIDAAVSTAIIDQNNGEPLPLGDDQEVYLATNPRYDYDIDPVFQILQENDSLTLLKQAASLSRPKLEQAIRGHAFEDRIKANLKKYFVKPSLKTRKKK